MNKENLAPDPRELLRKHNQMKEESRIRYYLDNKMTVTSIKPECLRRYHDVIMDAICSLGSDKTDAQRRLTMVHLISTASYLLGVVEGMTGNGRNTWKS